MPAGPGKNLLVQYVSFEDQATVLGEYEEMEQIVANQTSFTALANSGKIYTWGDGRYYNCLGRDIDEKYSPLSFASTYPVDSPSVQQTYPVSWKI